jgi:helix-turn-helix protein
MDLQLVRSMWHQLEPVNAVFWYAPEVFEEAAALSFAAIGAASEQTFAIRGWSGEEWDAARERLTARGWLDAAGQATYRCREGRDAIERRTDELAAGPWRAIGAGRTERLAELTVPLLVAALESGLLPGESTLGIGKIPAPNY